MGVLMRQKWMTQRLYSLFNIKYDVYVILLEMLVFFDLSNVWRHIHKKLTLPGYITHMTTKCDGSNQILI